MLIFEKSTTINKLTDISSFSNILKILMYINTNLYCSKCFLKALFIWMTRLCLLVKFLKCIQTPYIGHYYSFQFFANQNQEFCTVHDDRMQTQIHILLNHDHCCSFFFFFYLNQNYLN